MSGRDKSLDEKSDDPYNGTDADELNALSRSSSSSSSSMHDWVPYEQQGDVELYTPEAIAQRRALRTHPTIRRIINLFWHTYEKNSDGEIVYPEYVAVHVKMAKALQGAERFDVKRAQKLATREWKHDTGRDQTWGGMTYTQLVSSLFELADQWTDTIDAEHYVAFLRRLYFRITKLRKDSVETLLREQWARMQATQLDSTPGAPTLLDASMDGYAHSNTSEFQDFGDEVKSPLTEQRHHITADVDMVSPPVGQADEADSSFFMPKPPQVSIQFSNVQNRAIGSPLNYAFKPSASTSAAPTRLHSSAQLGLKPSVSTKQDTNSHLAASNPASQVHRERSQMALSSGSGLAESGPLDLSVVLSAAVNQSIVQNDGRQAPPVRLDATPPMHAIPVTDLDAVVDSATITSSVLEATQNEMGRDQSLLPSLAESVSQEGQHKHVIDDETLHRLRRRKFSTLNPKAVTPRTEYQIRSTDGRVVLRRDREIPGTARTLDEKRVTQTDFTQHATADTSSKRPFAWRSIEDITGLDVPENEVMLFGNALLSAVGFTLSCDCPGHHDIGKVRKGPVVFFAAHVA